MHRFYYDFGDSIKQGFEAIIIKEKDLLNQMINVLRFRVGENIALFNGKDLFDYIFEISKIEKNQIYLRYIDKIEKVVENNFELNLYQSLPNKLDKIEYILQKGVEVGISKFILFSSSRSQKIILSENKVERLKKIIIEAVEQSGRNKVPDLVILDKKMDFKIENGLNIYFHTVKNESIYLKDLDISNEKNINIFVGPEGGFSEKEIEDFKNIGFKGIFLGNRILRTETVGSVVGFYLGNKYIF